MSEFEDRLLGWCERVVVSEGEVGVCEWCGGVGCLCERLMMFCEREVSEGCGSRVIGERLCEWCLKVEKEGGE